MSFKEYLEEASLKAPGIHDILISTGYEWFSDGQKAKYVPVLNRHSINRLADLLSKNGYRYCENGSGSKIKIFKKREAFIDRAVEVIVASGNVQEIGYALKGY